MLAALFWSLASTPAAARDDGPTPVTLAEATRETWRAEVELTGTSTPLRRTELSPRVDGLVVEVAVDEGDTVAAGDPILTLDARLAEIERDAAAARVEQAAARQRDAIRVRDELLRLKQGRHASKTDIESAIAQVEIADAALSAARADQARAKELLRRHQLSAPFDGMVIAKQVEVGEWVQQGAAAIELVELDRLRVRATLPQRDYVRVAPGARARLAFDALPGRVFDGEVSARVAAGDPRSRSFPVLIDLPNPDRLLAPGMSARVGVELTDADAEVLTVPRDAIVVRSDGSRSVWRVEQAADGTATAEPVRVETGRANGPRVEVLRGDLAAGDAIVLLGNENLKPGQQVAPQAPSDAVASDGSGSDKADDPTGRIASTPKSDGD